MGYWATAGAYLLWGLFPLYWKLFIVMNPIEMTTHRIIWSLAWMAPFLVRTEAGREWKATLSDRRKVWRSIPPTIFLAINWGTYIFSVVHGHVVEASLGYFLVPLLSVALGRFLLREKLRPIQWVSVHLAAAGVAGLVILHGSTPWAAILIASSWSLYSLSKKRAQTGALASLAVEMTLLYPFALAFIGYLHGNGQATWQKLPGTLGLVFLATSGLVTIIPLLLFIWGVKRIPLSVTGILQYLVPTITFLLATLVYHEPFSREQLLAFCFIWAGLIVFSSDAIWQYRKLDKARKAI